MSSRTYRPPWHHAWKRGKATQLLLDQLRQAAVPPLPDPDALQLLGWLELPLDPADVVLVTSLNEGYIPTSVNADLFLPNTIRRQLGLLDNRRRFARDAYVVNWLLAARDQVQFFVARRDRLGDPKIPSRLIFACSPRKAAERASRFFQPSAEPSQQGGIEGRRERAGIAIPRPEPLPTALQTISVTAFRMYLKCPYRFYLRHVLGLTAVDDQRREMDALAFGTLAHEVLHQFGLGDCRDSDQSSVVRAELDRLLDDEVERRFGVRRPAAIDVQVTQLRNPLGRLCALAGGMGA